MTLEVKHATLVNASTYPDDATKPVGTELVGATLTAWTYTGFTMNVTTATIKPTVYFVCYP